MGWEKGGEWEEEGAEVYVNLERHPRVMRDYDVIEEGAAGK